MQEYMWLNFSKVFQRLGKKNLRGASAVILFSGKIFWHFSKIDEEDRGFWRNLLFLSKNFLRQNHPQGGFKPLLCQSLGQKHFKNSSTAPIIIIFIYKSRQENLIHDLPLQLCPSWPLFCRKRGVYLLTFFKGFSTVRLKKICRALPR